MVWDSNRGTPKYPNPFHKGIQGIQTFNPNQQLAISWLKPCQKTKQTAIVVLHAKKAPHIWESCCFFSRKHQLYMGVSKNNGIPKSSILIGFSIINHPFWGTPIFGNTHIKLVNSCNLSLLLVVILRLRKGSKLAPHQNRKYWHHPWRPANRSPQNITGFFASVLRFRNPKSQKKTAEKKY